MNIIIQIECLLLFLIFGFIMFWIYYLIHYHSKRTYIYYAVITLLTVTHIFILYNINFGKIHIYFVFMILLGILLGKGSVKFLKTLKKVLKNKLYE